MNLKLLRECIREMLREGSYNYDTSEAKKAIEDIRAKGYDDLANVLSQAWRLHDTLGDQVKGLAAYSKGAMSNVEPEDAFATADILVHFLDRTMKPRLEKQGMLTDYIDEEIGSAKSALDAAETPKDISLLVQRPAHNAIEGAVEKILDTSLN